MLSVLIITKNEQRKIKDCLESIKWADEIIVVDANSRDQTSEIASQYTDKIFTREFDNFKNQKNFGLSKCQDDWVLALDADERVSDELKQAIQSELKKPAHQAYAFSFLTYFCGQALKHGQVYPGRHIRLFKKQNCQWQREVHEQLVCDQSPLELKDKDKVGILKGDIIHYSYDSINHYFEKFRYYTDIDAKEMLVSGQDRFGRKIKVKPNSVWSVFWFLISQPHRLFIRRFFRYQGYRDGIYGLLYAIFSMFYDVVVRGKYILKIKAVCQQVKQN